MKKRKQQSHSAQPFRAWEFLINLFLPPNFHLGTWALWMSLNQYVWILWWVWVYGVLGVYSSQRKQYPKRRRNQPQTQSWRILPSGIMENHSIPISLDRYRKPFGTSSDILLWIFFVKQAPAPPLLTECLLVVSKWITFMHHIPNGINHSIAFPPIHCVK